MAVYQIDYDLRKQRNYQPLYDRLKSYRRWCRPLESTWVIEASQTASQVHDHLRVAMDSDDGLLVTRLAGEAAWSGVDLDVSRYLMELLERRAA